MGILLDGKLDEVFNVEITIDYHFDVLKTQHDLLIS
jgi:hypothetical protein